MMGVEKTKEVFADLQAIVVDAIKISKSGMNVFSSMSNIVALMGDIKKLAVDAPQALPELMDLDQDEAAQVGQAAYVCFKRIFDEFNK